MCPSFSPCMLMDWCYLINHRSAAWHHQFQPLWLCPNVTEKAGSAPWPVKNQCLSCSCVMMCLVNKTKQEHTRDNSVPWLQELPPLCFMHHFSWMKCRYKVWRTDGESMDRSSFLCGNKRGEAAGREPCCHNILWEEHAPHERDDISYKTLQTSQIWAEVAGLPTMYWLLIPDSFSEWFSRFIMDAFIRRQVPPVNYLEINTPIEKVNTPIFNWDKGKTISK